MSRVKNGNPQRASGFLCLHCMKLNQISGIQRFAKEREKYHVKDMICINSECKYLPYTKNMEIRFCDTYEEVYKKAARIRYRYYPEVDNSTNGKDGV